MKPSWKNSPVKASFPEDQRLEMEPNSEPNSGSGSKKSQLHTDHERYAMLLSSASSSMFDYQQYSPQRLTDRREQNVTSSLFDDDDDHYHRSNPVVNGEKINIDTTVAVSSNTVSQSRNSAASNAQAKVEDLVNSFDRGNSEQRGFSSHLNGDAETPSNLSRDSSGLFFSQTFSPSAASTPWSNESRQVAGITAGHEDYQLMKYIDFLAELERRNILPHTPSRNMASSLNLINSGVLMSTDELAEKVMQRVSHLMSLILIFCLDY